MGFADFLGGFWVFFMILLKMANFFVGKLINIWYSLSRCTQKGEILTTALCKSLNLYKISVTDA